MTQSRPIPISSQEDTREMNYEAIRSALIFMALLLFAVARTAASADWSPDGKKLLFWSDWNGNLEGYAISIDGTGLVNLTDHPAEDANPVWSPDGRRIAFYSKRDGNGEIYVMNSDGTGTKNLTNNSAHDFNPAWSPDGVMLTFQSYRDGHGQIYAMNADGTGAKNISNNEYVETNPHWSPDDSQIVYVSMRNGSRGIYSMNSDGSNQTLLIERKRMNFLNPKWSPDSQLIVFHSIFEDIEHERGAIYVMNKDGTDVQKITGDDVYNFNPFYSPDGSRIAYNIGDNNGAISIRVMDVNGSNSTLVTDGPPDDN